MLGSTRALAQDWILIVDVSGVGGSCALPDFEFSVGGVSKRGGDRGTTRSTYPPLYMTGSDWTHVSKTISAGIHIYCSAADDHSLSRSFDVSKLQFCSLASFDIIDGRTNYGAVTFRLLMNALRIAEPVQDCQSVQLTTSCLIGDAIWKISDPATGRTITANEASPTLSLTASMLSNMGFTDIYGKFFDVTVEDSKISGRISAHQNFTVFADKPVASLVTETPVQCHGDANATVTVSISNALSAVDNFRVNAYNLSDPSKDAPGCCASKGAYQIKGLSAGVWRFEIINDKDVNTYGPCSTTLPDHTIVDPTPVSIGFSTRQYSGFPIRCAGEASGEITATGHGGTESFHDFGWSTGSTNPQISGVPAGTYAVSLKDGNQCPASGSITLNQPPTLALILQPSDYNGYPVSCRDKTDGALTALAMGGVGSYTYQWTDGQTSQTAGSLGAKSYSVTVSDGNGCNLSSRMQLTAPPPIDFMINELSGLSCHGDQTAALEVQGVNHAIGAVSYVWSSGETTTSIGNKGSGAYSLTVSDEQGCSTTKSFIVADPPEYTVSLRPTLNYNGSFVKCRGDSNGELAAEVLDANGKTTTAENYTWSHDGIGIGTGPSLTRVDNLSKGRYKVMITYNRVCEAEATYFLAEPDAIIVNVAATSDYNGLPLSCHNAADANLRAMATGGTGVYKYQWNTGETDGLLTGKPAGDYMVEVTDANQCMASATLSILNPDPVEAAVVSRSDYSGFGVTCHAARDGSITVKASGGTGIYDYAWSNGQTTSTATGLSAGVVSLDLRDNNGCASSLWEIITEPPALVLATQQIQDILCFGGNDGAISLLASGGTGRYSFSKDNGITWQPGNTFNTLTKGTYTLTSQDDNHCRATTSATLVQPPPISIAFTDVAPAFCNNPAGTARAVVAGGVGQYTYDWQDTHATTIETDAILSNARGGIYTLTVRDSHNCIASDHVAITSTDGAQTTYTATPARCFDSSDGTADIAITRGDAPFAIQWPDGQATLRHTGLWRGTYDVLITDVHGCTVVQSVAITSPDALAVKVQKSVLPTCYGACDGQLLLSAEGGAGNYVYDWNNQSTAGQTQLCAAVYPVTLKDGNACTISTTVSLQQPDPLEVGVTTELPPTCKDGCDGTLIVAATGGNGNYIYAWSTGGSRATENNLCPGQYEVVVADQKGCKGKETFTMHNTPPVLLDLGGGATTCVGQSHTLNAGPGWQHVKWRSDTGLISEDETITIKDPGTYWLEVLDSKGCIGRDTFLLATSYDLLQASFLIPQEAEVGDTVVMVDISWPLPEKVEWRSPHEMEIISNTGDMLQGQFSTKGNYEVGLTAHLGACVDQLKKTIVIVDNANRNAGGRLGYETFVKEFSLYPNPNAGEFDVAIVLRDESPVTLSVWSSPMGVLMKTLQRQGESEYHFGFDLKPLASGTYVLRLDHREGRTYLRFVVR